MRRWNPGMARGGFGWKDSKGLARAILRDRAARRKVMGRLLLGVLFWIAAGRWLVDGWLAESPWRFLAWWGACALMTVVVMLFALYDALAVIREERDKFR